MLIMNCGDTNVWILNDHVSLPIIISDWDAVTEKKRSLSETTSGHTERSNSSATEDTRRISVASEQNWTTDFGQVAEDFWKSLTDGMKRKLRDACVEVLRRTDDEEIFSPFDDDARLLD